MSNHLTLLGFFVLLLFGLTLCFRWWRRRYQMARAEAGPEDVPRCARCGYDLSRLEYPRCPECGALRGFKVPLEQLGLTDEEVRTGFKRQREIRQSPDEAGGPTPPT